MVKIHQDEVRLDITHLDPVNQQINRQAIVLREKENRFYPDDLRFAWQVELDLMTRLAGL